MISVDTIRDIISDTVRLSLTLSEIFSNSRIFSTEPEPKIRRRIEIYNKTMNDRFKPVPKQQKKLERNQEFVIHTNNLKQNNTINFVPIAWRVRQEDV